MHHQWEYQHLEIGLPPDAAVDWARRDKALNDLGAQGWEVVSVMPTLWRAAAFAAGTLAAAVAVAFAGGRR